MVERGTKNKYGSKSFRQPKMYLERKVKRKRDYSKYFAFFSLKKIIVLILLLLVLWWLFFSKSFVIKDIVVQGNNLIPTDKIVSEVPINKNIFIVSSNIIEKNIKRDIPEVSDIQVYKGFPDAIKVVVVEYDQTLIWKVGDIYYLMDSQGRVYKDISSDLSKFTNLPVVEDTKQVKFDLGQQVVSPGFVAFADNIYTNVAGTANLHPDHFSISETTFDLNLYTKEGIYIKFDTGRSSKKQLLDLKSVMIQKGTDIHEYVDLRVDGWAYYK